MYGTLPASSIPKRENACSVRYNFKFKPDTEYELRFCMKLENVKNFEPKYSGFYVRMDDMCRHQKFPHKTAACFTGTTPWTPAVFRFRTAKEVVPGRNPRFAFVLGRASGKVWVDHVQLFEIKSTGNVEK